jgi:hypothetical protein
MALLATFGTDFDRAKSAIYHIFAMALPGLTMDSRRIPSVAKGTDLVLP